MLRTFDVWHAVKTCNSAIVFVCVHGVQDGDAKTWYKLPQMSDLPGAERSGVRNCNCLSDHLALKLMEEGAASVQDYPVKTTSAAIGNKL